MSEANVNVRATLSRRQALKLTGGAASEGAADAPMLPPGILAWTDIYLSTNN